MKHIIQATVFPEKGAHHCGEKMLHLAATSGMYLYILVPTYIEYKYVQTRTSKELIQLSSSYLYLYSERYGQLLA